LFNHATKLAIELSRVKTILGNADETLSRSADPQAPGLRTDMDSARHILDRINARVVLLMEVERSIRSGEYGRARAEFDRRLFADDLERSTTDETSHRS
jgi:hypothetical protein